MADLPRDWTHTGRYRYRSARRLFAEVLVLQIEEHCEATQFAPPGDVEFYRAVRWRDAKATDLSLPFNPWPAVKP